MHAIWITRHGGTDVLQVRESPDPLPTQGQVRVRVRAAGLNFGDSMARQGLYPDAPKPPCVVGHEGAGVVDALGPGVSGIELGTRVLFLTRFQGHASLVCVPTAQVAAIPAAMSFEVAAAIPLNYLTAYHMLFEIARLRGGEQLLIHMAAGGVGTAVLQLCRTVPGVVTYGTAATSKHDYLRECGCLHPIDPRRASYVETIRELTAGRGLDVVLDPLGGPDWHKGYTLLREGGVLIAFGFANMNTGDRRRPLHMLKQLARVPRFSPVRLMNDNRTVSGMKVGLLYQRPELLQQELGALIALFERGQIRPHVFASYPFSRAADAHADLEQRRNVGKVVLVPNDH
jgi:NADPH:quinone reductase-like Zn-dependent oxidoreductase